ncbi:chymotrypsin-like elastase family member 2A isoform X2 [Atheta coriaria]|uniref:chymotrypsin-like elastase family member 2A isoform X2 n=1 Tax=Dalotia coriaria TaxID=877792 RepID=UPI0031F4766B
MAIINLLILLCCAAVFVSAQNADVAKAGERIWGGVEAERGQFKWQVGIANKLETGYYYPVYSGALISKQWVLTHPNVYYSNYDYDVILGATRLYDDQDGKIITKFEIIVHNSEYYAALGKLVAPVQFTDYIGPIKLPKPTDYLAGGTSVWASGWGWVNDSSYHTNELRGVDLITLDPENCASGLYQDFYVCTDGSEGKCPWLGGDEGGALGQNVNGEWILVATMSFGHNYGCANGEPTVYTRTTHLLDFIYANMDPIINYT